MTGLAPAAVPHSMMTGEEATARGYRRVSNRYRWVARVDRPDFVQVLAKHLRHPVSFFLTNSEKNVQAQWCDHYRRVYSCDVVILREREYEKVPASGHDPVGYVEVP